MKHPRAPDGWGPVPDPPWDVRVTIISAPRRPAPARALRSRAVAVRATLALVVVAGAVGAGLVATAGRETVRAPAALRVGAGHAGGAPAVAAAYRYPLGCLGATLAASDGGSGSAGLEGSSACWRYGVYVTVVLRRIGASWRLALEAVSRSCPAVALPAYVRAQLAGCLRSDPARARAR